MARWSTMRRGSLVHGTHWIIDWRRQAIFHRDGDRCCWCGATDSLCLDHLTPRGENGGTNASENLVTSCKSCNDLRRNASLLEWGEIMEAADLCEPGHGARIVSSMVARAELVPIDEDEGKKRVAAVKPAHTRQGQAARRKTKRTPPPPQDGEGDIAA